MLIKDMEQYQIDNNKYPGLYSVTKTLQITSDTNTQQATIDDVVSKSDSRINAIGIASENTKTTLIDDCLYIVNGERNGSELSTRLKLIGMTDSLDHMKLVRGELPSKTSVDGVYEGLASEDALKTLGINMGNTYKIVSLAAGVEPYYVKITGVYEQKTDNDSYWAETLDSYLNAIFVDYDMVRNDLMPAGRFNAVNIARRYSLDYHTLDMNRISAVTAELEKDDAFYKEAGYAHEFNVADIIGNYTERAEKLTRILWILQIPAMVMLAFYLFIVSQLNVVRERNEIAVFKSRGASSWQIFGMYAAESGILGIVTLVVAPFIGLVLCQFLGVSYGFLEFVNRTGIAAKITGISIIYALLAVVVIFLTTNNPIIPATKLPILQNRQSRT